MIALVLPDTGSAEELQTSLLWLCNGMDTLGKARELVKRRLEAGNNPELERERNRPETPTGETEQEASGEDRPY